MESGIAGPGGEGASTNQNSQEHTEPIPDCPSDTKGAGPRFNVRIHAAMANHDLETDATIFQKQQAEKHRCIELDWHTMLPKYSRV